MAGYSPNIIELSFTVSTLLNKEINNSKPAVMRATRLHDDWASEEKRKELIKRAGIQESVIGTPSALQSLRLFELNEEQLIYTSDDHEPELQLVNMMQDILDRDNHIPQLSPPDFNRNNIRRLLVMFSTATNTLPFSLFIDQVTCTDNTPFAGGGFADVYRGIYKGQKVAMKRFRIFQIASESRRRNIVKCFYREALTWRQLDHPNIQPLLGIDRNVFGPNLLLMVSPWQDGGNVIDYRNNHEVPTIIFEKWLVGIAEGLSYLHAEEIIYGDLRGVNILVASDLNVRLTDFGMSIMMDATTYNRGGAPKWLAPEIMDPEEFGLSSAKPTAFGDIYSFACTCVEIITGRPPFPGYTDTQVTRLDHGGQPERPSNIHISDELWALMESCWSRKMTERPSAATVVAKLKGMNEELILEGITAPTLL